MNLCYRNASFALLLHTPSLLIWAHEHAEQHGLDGGCLMCDFAHLCERYWGDAEDCIFEPETEESAAKCWGAIVDGAWDNATQQDAREFLELALSRLHETAKQTK
jgi:hypothetical protein